MPGGGQERLTEEPMFKLNLKEHLTAKKAHIRLSRQREQHMQRHGGKKKNYNIVGQRGCDSEGMW